MRNTHIQSEYKGGRPQEEVAISPEKNNQCCGSLFVGEQFKIINEQPSKRRELRGGSKISRAQNFLLAENESRGDVR